MNIIVHRGTHEIGGSCIEVFSDNTRVILDIGKALPALINSESKSVSTPKVNGLFKGNERAIDAVLISHGHSDHIGLVNELNTDIPIYIGEEALKIYNTTSRFIGDKEIANPTHHFKSGVDIAIGDLIITPYLLDHSGFDAYGFLIKNNNNTIVYTGDFRCHGRKKKTTQYFMHNLPKEIDLLIVEGTMISRPNEIVQSEESIEEKACAIMKSRNYPIFVLQSSTNIDRLVSFYKAAKSSERIFVMDIFTAHIVSQLRGNIPKPHKFKDIKVFYPYHLTKRMCKKSEGEELMMKFAKYKITRKELGERKDYCMLVRDSMLSDFRYIKNIKEAGFIYSIWSGYKSQKRIKRMLDFIKCNNMEFFDLHTSGHAPISTIQDLVSICKPKRILPIHTESPDSFDIQFNNVCLINNGELISI